MCAFPFVFLLCVHVFVMVLQWLCVFCVFCVHLCTILHCVAFVLNWNVLCCIAVVMYGCFGVRTMCIVCRVIAMRLVCFVWCIAFVLELYSCVLFLCLGYSVLY